MSKEESQARIQAEVSDVALHRVRRANLKLLRLLLDARQAEFGEASRWKLSQTDVSKYERGDEYIRFYTAEEWEKEYDLPNGWMSRDNSTFMLALSLDENELLSALRRAPGDVTALLNKTMHILLGTRTC